VLSAHLPEAGIPEPTDIMYAGGPHPDIAHSGGPDPPVEDKDVSRG